jgi:hypothetical protein
MAKCDQGYLCDVCGRDVPDVTDSDLYLRYVIGEIDGRALLSSPERHLRCNPTLAQFIVDPEFEPVPVEGPFAKAQLAEDDVRRREQLVTRGWRRLQEVRQLGLPISDYPLPEVRPVNSAQNRLGPGPGPIR